MYPVAGPIEVRDGKVIAAFGAFDTETGLVQPGSRDPRVIRNGDGWSWDGRALPAAAASGWRPIAYDRGVLWADGGHIWRWTGGAVRAVANAPRDARLSVGPTGGFAVGGDQYTQAAAPGHSAVVMPTPFDATHWGVRWSEDGEILFGVDAEGKGWSWDIARRALTSLPGLPLDATTTVNDRVPGFDRPIVEASCALSGHLLAGPGGLVWDLRAEAPVADTPVIRLGTTFALSDRFGTLDWERGAGSWVDHQGVIVGDLQIPLDTDDALEQSWGEGDHGWVITSAGRAFRVGPDSITEADEAPEPPEPETVGRRTKHGIDLGAALPFPADQATIVGDRTFAWSQDGLLVRLANGVPPR